MSNRKERFDILNFDNFLDQLRKNDTRTWNQLDFVLKRIILRWIASKGIAKEFVKEVYNETMAVFIEKFSSAKFDSFSGMKSYVFSIAENKIKEQYRKSKKNNFFDPIDNANISNYVDYFDLVDKEEKKHKIHTIYNLFEQLTKLERKIMILSYKEEKTHEEIASILDLTIVNVRVIKHRAIQKIKKWINNN
jgi:RNA polymerase sigma-70 factor (ECF subfamily)